MSTTLQRKRFEESRAGTLTPGVPAVSRDNKFPSFQRHKKHALLYIYLRSRHALAATVAVQQLNCLGTISGMKEMGTRLEQGATRIVGRSANGGSRCDRRRS